MSRLIKRYGNRRLYDTEASRYLTLAELSALLRDGEPVKVVDAKTGEDRTQPVLASLLLEERGGARLLPVPLLRELLRLDDPGLAEVLGVKLGALLADLSRLPRR